MSPTHAPQLTSLCFPIRNRNWGEYASEPELFGADDGAAGRSGWRYPAARTTSTRASTCAR